jgi:hypothetical protein
MLSIEIEFCHSIKREEVFVLRWEVLEHEAAFVWFNLFCDILKSEKEYFTRFTGFIESEKNEAFLLSSLQKCIDIINADGKYFIEERAIEFNQKFSNIIHHHFEILSGTYESSTPFIQESSKEVQHALNGLNYFIHDLEAYTRNKESSEYDEDGNSFSGVIVEVKECERFVIPKTFENFFTTDIVFGDLVAHYSQIGKTWLEAYYDKDEDIFKEAIRPHYALSGEFDIMFGELSINQDSLNEFLLGQGQNPKDPALKLGHLPLAKLIREKNITNKMYKQKLAYHADIKSIKALSDNSCIAQKDLKDSILFFK